MALITAKIIFPGKENREDEIMVMERIFLGEEIFLNVGGLYRVRDIVHVPSTKEFQVYISKRTQAEVNREY